jgi:hypothetical protein
MGGRGLGSRPPLGSVGTLARNLERTQTRHVRRRPSLARGCGSKAVSAFDFPQDWQSLRVGARRFACLEVRVWGTGRVRAAGRFSDFLWCPAVVGRKAGFSVSLWHPENDVSRQGWAPLFHHSTPPGHACPCIGLFRSLAAGPRGVHSPLPGEQAQDAPAVGLRCARDLLAGPSGQPGLEAAA